MTGLVACSLRQDDVTVYSGSIGESILGAGWLMAHVRTYFVYILASKSRRLYIGITSDLERRVWQHKTKALGGFTARYNIDRLVHVEDYSDVHEAIAREKQLKNWRREKKIALIASRNPTWRDLSVDLFPDLVDDSRMTTTLPEA
jgi:putative endonuclease